MKNLLAPLLLTVSIMTAAIGSVRAESPAEALVAFERQFSKYDQRAVQAVRHYYQTPSFKKTMIVQLYEIKEATLKSVCQQNPGLTEEQLADVENAVSDAMKDRLDMFMQMNMLAALDTFTTEELVAMDGFYSSPIGVSIAEKMPKLAAQMPAMTQRVMPDYINDIRNKIKAKGMELKL